MKKKIILALVISLTCFITNAKNVFSTKSGDPTVILTAGKKATLEIDYSKMIVTDGDHEDDKPFIEWLNDDSHKEKDGINHWVEDWPQDKKVVYNHFVKNFNDENDKGVTVDSLGKDYKFKIIMEMIDWGPAVVYGGFLGVTGGRAKITGVFEVRDFETNEVICELQFTNQIGDSSFKQIGRLKGAFEWLGNDIISYAKKIRKKANKKK